MEIESIRNPLDQDSIAIIGMAGRFPRSGNLEEYWRNIRGGIECIRSFEEDELEIKSPANPGFVPAGGVLEEIDMFDAGFFGIPPSEAKWIDPQHRVFLESCWLALENAAYDPERHPGSISVYAGCNLNTYLLGRLDRIGAEGELFQVLLGNEKDFLATRVSYKLNLRGEGITVQSSCSSSLVAVHLACQSLLTGQSDLALAGGVSIRVPQKTGYTWKEGLISSPDGHCRPFDHRAAGTVPGNGVGVVVLKRMPEAVRDRDRIRAVIRGSAINNDGRAKVGYTAPGLDGQADVIAKALAFSAVSADTIGYLEAHGTATPAGDPIELEALKRAFRRQTDRKAYCALGAVKANVGHLDTAAGVAGLIKSVLALEAQEKPPLLNFETPNPALDLSNSPFYASRSCERWVAGQYPRRAGVSSFGIGGTNAHLILEEASPAERSRNQRPMEVVTLSAKTPSALVRMRNDLGNFLRGHAGLDLGDLAFTRNFGRGQFPYRQAFVAKDTVQLGDALLQGNQRTAYVPAGSSERVVFVFPGQGSNLGACFSAHRDEVDFTRHVDRCSEILRPLINYDVRELTFASEKAPGFDPLSRFVISIPALFVLEYALAQMWIGFGIKPSAMIGHSLGEYTAACLAGIFSLEDVLGVLVERGRIIDGLPEGAMLTVPMDKDELRPLLTPELSIAAVNGDKRCVVSGPSAEIAELEARLAGDRVHAIPLKTTRAYHSRMMDAALPEVRAAIGRVRRGDIKIPLISGTSGEWLSPARAADPAYWAEQMRKPIEFSKGLNTLRESGYRVFVEVGPNQNLCRALKVRDRDSVSSISSLPAPNGAGSQSSLQEAIAELWTAGVNISWEGYHGTRARRIEIPAYPFERESYWIESSPVPVPADASANKEPKMAEPIAAVQKQTIPGDSQAKRALITASYVPARNDIERTIANIWADQLGIDVVGIHDDFAELGGDSLIATLIVSRIRQAFSIAVSIAQMLSGATVEKVARIVQADMSEAEGAQRTPSSLPPDAYCAFEMKIGDDQVTVQLDEADYLLEGIPAGAQNVRFAAAAGNGNVRR